MATTRIEAEFFRIIYYNELTERRGQMLVANAADSTYIIDDIKKFFYEWIRDEYKKDYDLFRVVGVEELSIDDGGIGFVVLHSPDESS